MKQNTFCTKIFINDIRNNLNSDVYIEKFNILDRLCKKIDIIRSVYTKYKDDLSIAKSSNLNAINQTIKKPDELINRLDKVDSKSINFLYVKCGLDDETPRPPLDVVKVSKF
jgi:hypothetical protein